MGLQRLSLESLDQTNPLEKALFELGICPFDDKSVGRYKKRRQWRANLPCKIVDFLDMSSFFLFFGPACLVIISICVSAFLPMVPWWLKLNQGAAFTSVFGFLLGFVMVVIDENFSGEYRNIVCWRQVSLLGFKTPESAMVTMRQIEEKCPSVYFYLEMLYPEIFVVAQANGIKRHVDLWDARFAALADENGWPSTVA